MTPNDHLAERYGAPVRGEHPGPLEDWTELEQAHHRAELLAAIAIVRASHDYDATAEQVRKVFETRQQLADDLPPDSRPHAVIVRAAGS